MSDIVSRIGITPAGSPNYRLNRLRFHLLAYTLARKAQLSGQQGKFIIRCDDTDIANVDRSYLDPYLRVLANEGVKADLIPYDKDQNGFSLFQSERSEIYRQYCDSLISNRLAFIDSSGAMFFHTAAFAEKFKHLLSDNKLTVEDWAMGKFIIDIRTPLKDDRTKRGFESFPIVRSNGNYLFNICSPVDDATMSVTDVVRDRDKLSLLPQQEMVRIALGLPSIRYIHAPLLVNSDGKRFINDPNWGEATYQNFVSKGISSTALISYLLSGFYGPSEKYYLTIDDFASKVDFTKIHQAHTVFSRIVLMDHDKKLCTKIEDKLYGRGFQKFLAVQDPVLADTFNLDPLLIELVLKMRRQFPETQKVVQSLLSPEYRPIEPENISHVEKLLSLLDNSPSRENYESFLIDRYELHCKELSMSKKEYYMALRLILTGQSHGYDLKEIVRYLERKNLIQERINLTRSALQADKNSKPEIGAGNGN